MMDSNIMGAANPADVLWLRDRLQSREAREALWTVVVMHHPMWPSSDIPKDLQRAETMREHFLPVFEEYGVDLILCGHQHVYSRTESMRGDAASDDGTGIVQVMAASGDKATYPAGDKEYIAVSAAAPNYLLITVANDTLNMTALSEDNEVIDTYMLTRK